MYSTIMTALARTCIIVAELVSHPEMSPLNEVASRNIEAIFVTESVSHPEMSPLKEIAR